MRRQAPVPSLPSRRRPQCLSPLLLADRLLALARRAERDGMPGAASALLRTAYRMCDPVVTGGPGRPPAR